MNDINNIKNSLRLYLYMRFLRIIKVQLREICGKSKRLCRNLNMMMIL